MSCARQPERSGTTFLSRGLRCVNRRPSLAPPSASAAAAPNRRARRTTASATRRARCGLPFACVGSTAHGLPQRGCYALAGLHVVVQMHQLPKPPRRPRRRAYDAPPPPAVPQPLGSARLDSLSLAGAGPESGEKGPIDLHSLSSSPEGLGTLRCLDHAPFCCFAHCSARAGIYGGSHGGTRGVMSY